MTKNKFIVFIIIVVILVAGLGFLFSQTEKNKTSELDGFAQCISDSGAKFYNAFWCNFCQSQKKMFGSAAKYLPDIECSTLDGRSQLPVCQEAGIDSYPTWEFADGERMTGLLSFETLAEKTQCQLPQ
jgi:hypothetical protein